MDRPGASQVPEGSGEQRKMEDNIREWTGLEFAKSQGSGEQGDVEETGREIIYGAPRTLAVQEYMR